MYKTTQASPRAVACALADQLGRLHVAIMRAVPAEDAALELMLPQAHAFARGVAAFTRAAAVLDRLAGTRRIPQAVLDRAHDRGLIKSLVARPHAQRREASSPRKTHRADAGFPLARE